MGHERGTAIETRPLGRDGPRLTRVGLGMAALGRPAYITLGHAADLPGHPSPEALERHAHAVLDAAYAAGVRYVDAARSYGRAEQFVRSWLDARGLPAGDVVVGSKWGYRYTGDWQLRAARHEVKDHSLSALREQLAESRAALGPHLALYQIHSATEDTGVLGDDAVLDALASVRDGGVRVGVTVSGPGQAAAVRRALGIRRGGDPLFASVQATWNLLERSCEDALREAHAAGRAVLVKEALANGRLGPRGDAAAGPLGEIAAALGATVDAVALAAALAQPFADVVLLGASTVPQLASNLEALGVQLPVGAQGALATLREGAAEYWRRRAGLPWT
ncbi:oxidoreductase [Anaeromyxobacter oryzae]|uniref:Oxidoreductase n=2 Tax=Anaeromyxobacter oryzae TaxID=2918170 RepID=A0ABN6MXA3_9BACT|nr:oxidoreductase [Anaeromyxobacter oryzae]